MYNMPAGAFVYEVNEGSAGATAGLKQGDIITKFDGIDIDSSDALVETLGYYEAGETVTMEVQEAVNGSYVAKEVEVTLQEGTAVNDQQDGQQGAQNDQQRPEEMQGAPYNEFPQDRYFDDNGGFGDIYDYFFNDGDNYF